MWDLEEEVEEEEEEEGKAEGVLLPEEDRGDEVSTGEEEEEEEAVCASALHREGHSPALRLDARCAGRRKRAAPPGLTVKGGMEARGRTSRTEAERGQETRK